MQTAPSQPAVITHDPIGNVRGLPSPTVIDPVNRKAVRTFNSLFRRRKLRHLSSTRMFTPGFVQFCALNLKGNW